MNLINCNDVCVSYEKVKAVNNVSFTVDEGDYLCIVGENGSGKSTIMKCILGLLRKDSGEIKYNGIKQNDIGYLPQYNAVTNDFPASVHEVVISGCLNHGVFRPFYNKTDKNRADEYIKLLEISNIEKKSYRELSGGQRQRVLLARALCASNKLLMLDEPVTGLDPMVCTDFYGLIKRLNVEQGLAVVMVSHDIHCALENCGKILHMGVSETFFGNVQDYRQTHLCRRMLGGEGHD